MPRRTNQVVGFFLNVYLFTLIRVQPCFKTTTFWFKTCHSSLYHFKKKERNTPPPPPLSSIPLWCITVLNQQGGNEGTREPPPNMPFHLSSFSHPLICLSRVTTSICLSPLASVVGDNNSVIHPCEERGGVYLEVASFSRAHASHPPHFIGRNV